MKSTRLQSYTDGGRGGHAFKKYVNLNQPNQTEMKYYILIPHNNSFLDLEILKR